MFSIWPPNCFLPAGLVGSRVAVFPFEWPVSCPPRNSSKVGSGERPTIILGRKHITLAEGFCSKFAEGKKTHLLLRVALWTNIIFSRSAAVSRFVLSRKPAPQWPTRGTQMVVPGGRIGALESPQTLFLGLQTLKSLVSSFFVF